MHTPSPVPRMSLLWIALLVAAAFACDDQRAAPPSVAEPSASPATETPDAQAIAPRPEARVASVDAGPSSLRDTGKRAAVEVTPPAEVAARPRLRFIEIVTAGADPESPLPLVVAVHGLGGSPYGFKRTFSKVRFEARVVLPQAPTPWRSGFSWYPSGSTVEPVRELTLDGIRKSAEDLVALMNHVAGKRPTIGRPIITGFSQGGIMSFAVAALHPQAISAALPLAGLLPRALWPQQGFDKLPPIVAFHGDRDERVPTSAAQDIVKHLSSSGGKASLQLFEVAHSINGPMHIAWGRDMSRQIDALKP